LYSSAQTSESSNQIYKNYHDNPTPDNLRLALGLLVINCYKSQIPLKEITGLLNDIEHSLKGKPELQKQEFMIRLAKAMIEENKGRHKKFNAIINETKVKLIYQNELAELYQLNFEAANFLSTRDYRNEAINLYKENEILWHKIPEKSSLIRLKISPIENCNALGFLFENAGQYDSAEKYYGVALERAKLTGEKFWTGLISGNLGQVLFLKGNLDSAEYFLQLDINYSIESGVYGSAIFAIFTLVDIKIQRKDYAAAKSLLDQTKTLFSKIKNPEIDLTQQYNIHYESRHAKLLFQKAEINEAMKLFYQLIDLQEQRNKEQKLETTKQNNTRYAFEDNVLQIETLEKQHRQNIFILTMVVLVLLFACIFIYSQIKFSNKLKLKSAEISRQAKNLEELNLQKNKLFSILSHDLRSPVGNLINILDMQKEGMMDLEDFEKFIPIVGDSLKSVSATLENLLTWAKAGMGSGIQVQLSFVSLKPIIEEVISQSQSLLDAKKIKIKIEQSEESIIWADPALLTIVLRNLLANAIKFSHVENEIIVAVQWLKQPKKHCVIHIIDQGIGMTEEVAKNLFSANSENNKVLGTAGEQGIGLGLIICKEFTEAMGGKISAKSTINVGSTFSIELPAQ